MRNVLLAVFLLLSVYIQAVPSGYSFYKKLTTQENQITVGATNSSGFPVLVKITDPDLRSVNNGGRVRSANGYDIVFTAGDKNTLIPFQVEEYDATTGEYVAWVKLPVLSATVNTDFYMYFGNASIATTLGSKTTWDANYKAVYHLNSDVADWTSNAASLTNSGTTNFSPGIAADGQRVGSGTYLSRPATSGLQITGDLTIETWINFNSLISGSNENLIVSSSSNGSGSNFNTNYSLSVVGSGSSTGTFVFRWQYGNNSDEIVTSSVPFTSLAGSGWRNVVVTRDNSSKQIRFYVDGIQLGTPVAYVNSATGGSSNSFLIGKNLADASRTLDAAMDEVRISNSVRGPEWIQAAYMSYKPASTFLTYSQTFSVSANNFCFCNVGMPGYTSLGVFNTHTYFISTVKETWQNADSIASSLGGHLVSINTATENLFLSTAVLDRFWIGLTDSVTEGTFVWTSGETVTFTNWSVLQPNNSGNSDYALFNTSLLTFWDDLPDSPQLYVIEFDCTAPTATLVTANAGVDQTICGTSATMAATFSPASASGQWAVYSGAGTFSNSNSATTTVSGLSNGSNLLIWKVAVGSCAAAYDTVKVLTDTILPKIVCPTNIFATNTIGQCSGIGTWTLPSITDNCPGPVLTQISGLSNGASFPVGTSSVSYRVTDNSGNTANCSFFVTVSDDEAPKIICSGDLSFSNDPGLCGSFVTGIAPLTTADNCSGFTVTYTISGATILSGNDDASGSFFNIGSSKLIYTITDATGNQTSCSFNITIFDTETPIYSTCPTNITVGANPGLCSAIVSWPAPVATDNCPGVTIAQSAGPSSGSAFPVGTTTIKYIATDASLNSIVCLFDITVEDTIAPVFISCPSNITLPSTAAMCGSVVNWTDPVFADNCPGAILSQVSGLPSGSVFPVGTTTVVYKVIDAANLSRFCSFSVTITDVIPPVFSSCPLDIFVNTTPGNCGAIVNWPNPAATDNCALASLFQTSGLPNGSFFPVGSTSISYIARDAASNTSTCNFNIIVSDVEPPSISCPANLTTVNDSGFCSAILNGLSPLVNSDNCGSTTLSYTITGATVASGGNDASGTAFNMGNSLVTYLLKDNVGNTSTCSFNVTVNPVVTFSDAGPSQLICDTVTTMAANTPLAALGTWSLISGSGSIVSPNSPTSQITGMAAGTSIFRWTVENSSCASSFSDVSITVEAKPSTAIAGPKQIICSNSGNLSANIPVVGQGNWTLIAGLGSIANPISATSAVSALGLGNNVFRWTITNGVCPPSFDDDTILVVANPSVANAGADQTSLCGVTSTALSGNTPSVGTGAWSIVSGVGGSFVAATNPTTTFNGVVGNSYILRWTISNAPCAASSDDVLITLNANPSVANAGADQTSLCGVASTSLSGNTPSVGTGAWSIVSGVGGSFVSTSNPTTTFNGTIGTTYTLRWTINNAPCAASSDDVVITFNTNPSVANAGADQTSLCGVTSTSLSGNTPSVGTGAWSIVSGIGGSFVAATNPTTTFNGVIGNSYVLRWTISNAPCAASSDDVLITFNANPSVANAGADQTSLCGVTSTALSGNTPSSGTGAWSIVSGVGGSFVAATNPTTTFNGVVGNSYILRWTINNAPCAASSDDVLITFNANPSVANAGADQTSLCGVTSTSLSGNTPSVGTGAWSIVSGVGGSFVAATNPTTTFNGVIGNSYVLRWTISNAPCAASSDDVLITFNANPSVANAGADQTSLCGATTTTLSANTPAVGNGTWSIVSGIGGSFVSTSNPTTTFNGTIGTTYTLRWTINNAPCAASSDDVVIVFNANPSVANAGTDQTSLCGVTSTALSGNTPSVGTGAWSIVSGIGGSFVATSNPTTTFNGTIGTTYTLRWTISNAPCAASSDDVLITFNANPSVANAGADQTSLCGVTSTALLGNTPGVGTGAWSIVSGVGGSFVAATNPTTTFNGVVGNSYVLRWTISNAPCTASSDDVLITFNANPSVANAGADQTSLCGVASTSLSGNTPSVGTGAWSIISGIGGSFVSTSNPTTTFNGTIGTTYTLRWTINNAPCAASSDDVLITFNANPSVANAGADQTSLCGVTSTSLSGNTPSVGTGTWSIVSGIGGSFVAATNPTTTFNGVIGNSYVLRWTISNAPCTASSDDVLITFNANPSVANAGADQTSLCGVTSTALSGNTPSVGTGAWSIVSGVGGSFVSTSNPTTTFNGVVGNSYILRWTINNAPCAASSDDVLIAFNANPSVANAGTDQTSLCGVTSTALSGNTPSVGTGAWSIVSGIGGSLVSTSNPTTTFNGTIGTTYTLRWTINNAPCAASSDDVVITFNSNPSVANAGADQTTLCGVTTTTLSANTPAVGNGTWSIVSGIGGSFVSTSNPTTTFNGTIGTAYTLRWTINNAPCAASSDDVLITFNANPSVANAGIDQISALTCGLTSVTLSGNTPVTGNGLWTIISGGIGSFSNASQANSLFSAAPGVLYTLKWTISNGCGANTDTVLIKLNANPTTALAGADQTIACDATSTLLAANSPIFGIGTWSIVSGLGGSVQSPNSPISSFAGTLSNAANASYTLRWTITNAPCVSSNDDVVITFPRTANIADAGTDIVACGTTSTTLNAGTPGAAHTGVWTLISGTSVGSFSNPTSRNSTFTGSPGAIYVLRWTITRTATGCISFDEVTVSFPLNPVTANAGSDQLSICGANSLTLSANGPGLGTGQWSIISGLGGVFSNSNDPAALFTGVVGATYTLRWTISSAICGSTFDEVSIAFNSNSTPANAGNDQLSLCGVNSTFLTANTPISGVGNWAIVSGVGGFVNSTNDPQSQFTGILGNTYTLEWSIQNPPCVASKDSVIITFNGLPTSSIAGPNQTICGNSVVMSANTPIFGNGLWSVISGSAVFANPTSPVSAVSGLGLGINTLRWEISTPNCGSSFSDLSITVTSIPAVANAGPDQTSLCGISSTTLAANTPNIGLATWTVVTGSGGTFQDINNPTTTFNGLLGNSYVLRWTISNPPCADSFDDVIVTFHDLPSIAQAGVDQTICSSNTSLAATTPLIGNGIWQVIAGTSTVAIPANPLSAVSSLSLGNNQFVWTVSNGTCAPSRDTITVFVETPASVAQAGVDQTICSSNTSLAATTPLVGSGNWQVIAGSSTVANPSNPLSAVSNLSLGNNTFVWTVSNGTCAPSRDTITVFVETPASVAQAGVDQTICSSNTSLAATTPLVGSGNWQVIAGTSTVANPANPLSAVSSLSLGNNQFVWTVSNGTCAPSRDTITVFVDTPASIAQAGVDQTICASNTSLGATTPLVGSGNWQVIAGSSTVANPANPLSTVSSLSLGNNTFVWTVSNGTCAPSSDTVSVFVNSPASVAQAGVDQTICSTNTSLTATTPLVGSGSWQVIAGSSTVANTTNPLSTVSNLSLGNNTFVWTVSNGACTPSSDTITVFVETPASIAQAGVDQTICASNTSLTATIPLVGNGSWQVIAGSSTVANPVNPLSAVSGLSLGNNTFVWTVSNGTCAPSSDTVSVFVDTPASIAQAGVDQTICSSNTSLAATTPMIGNGSWQVIAGSSTVANPANPLSTVSSLSLGNNTFVWTVSNGTCTPSNDTVTVFVNSPVSFAQAGVDQTICSSNTSLTATTPIVGSGNWQVIAGSSTVANTTNPLSTVSNLSLGNNTFVWTVSNGTCAPSSDTVTVFVETLPSVAQAGVDQTICSTNTSLTATTPLIGNGSWQVIAGSSTVANLANPLSTVSNLSLGNNQFVWTVSNGTCAPSSDTVSVFVNSPVSVAQAGVDQTICSSNTSLTATTPIVGSGNWQVIAGSSTVANTTNPLSTVSNLSLGNNTFVWTISNGTCAPSSDTVSVFVNSPASVAQAGVDQTICSTNASLTATTPLVGSGSWQVIAGTSTVANPTNPLSTVSNLSLGNNTFVWTVSNGTCTPNSDTVTVFVDESPSPAFAGTNQTICASTTILAATVPLVGGGLWTVVSGTGVFANAGDAATSVSGIINDTNIYRWTVGNGICPSVFSDVMIIVASNPPVADAGPNDTICGNSTTLSGNISAVGIGNWTLVSGSGNFVNANSAITLVNNLGSGDNIFRWTLNNPPCTPTFDDVTIHVTSIPAIADAGRDTTICSVDSIALNGNNLVSQSKKWTILSGGGGSFTSGIDTLANSVFHGIPDSTYVLRWTLSNPPCADSFDDVVITFLRAPSTSIAGNDQTGISTCGLTSLSLAANTPNSGVGTWSVQSGVGGTIQSTSSPNSLFTGVSGSTYLLTWTIANTCGSSQSDVLITFNQNPDTALAGNDSTICASTIQLGANIPSFGTGFWKSISGTGIFSDTLLPNTTISSLSAGIHTLVWEIGTTICGSSYDTLTIQVDSLPTFLYAGNDQTICDSTSTVALNATAASIGNSFWSIISGSGTFQNPTLFNSTVNQLTNGINLLAWNVNNGVCPTITDTLVVMVDTPPSAANAGNNRIVCTNFVVLKADSITSGTGLWTQTLGTGANISQPNNDTTLVNQLQLGLNSFTWTVSNGVCPSNSDTVYVDVNQASSAAVAGADTTICESTDSISIHALAPIIGIGSWKVLIGPSIISDTLQASTYIKGLQKGLNKIVWTVRNGLCSDFDVVNILVDSLPTPAIAGVIPPVCETSTSVLLAANQAITGVGQWTSASGIPVFADTNLATSTVTNLQIGSNLLYWTISNGACQGVSSSVLVHVDQLPDSAKAGLDIRSCEGFSQLTLAADSPLVGIGYWTKLSGPLNILDTANAHTALTGAALAPYSSSFSWTTSNGVCPLMVDTVNVLVDAYPSSSFAGINDTICSTNIQLNASPPLVGLGQWTSLSGTIQFADSNLATTNANGLSTGSNTLYWTVSNGVCADSVSTVIVFVDVAPSIALAGVDISACENTSGISLNAILPSIGSGTWTVLSGSFQLVNSNQANSALQNIGAGNSIFVWSVVNGTCPSSSDTVSVTVSALPSSAVVGANQLLCENASLANVSAVAPTSGIGSWTVIQGGGTIVSPTSATTQVTFNPGVNSYAYTVTNGTCPSSIDTAFVTVDSISAPAFAGNDLAICENTTAVSLNATFVNYGLAQWTSLTPGISIVNPTQNNTAISGVALGINQLVWTSTNGVCPANSDTVEIIVSALPSSATAGTNQNWCDTITQIQLQGNIPQVGSGVWIPVSGSGTISNPSSAITTVSGLQVGSAVFEWVISSGACTPSRDSVSITINASPTPSIAGVNQSYCINSNAITLNGNVPTIGSGTWSLLSGNATIDNVSQANSGIQVSDSGNYVFNWTITNGVCQSTSSTEIHIDALPSSANAGADITANTPVVFLNAEIPQIGTGTWLLFQGAGTILDINNPATQVSGLGQGTSILSWTVSNGVCAYSADEITISYLDLAIPNAISPNNDGINDAFVIPGLEYYSNVKFTLFNSWGTIVYESNDYKNDFAGLTESGQRLIDDTYYYVLQISSDLEYKGYLILKK